MKAFLFVLHGVLKHTIKPKRCPVSTVSCFTIKHVSNNIKGCQYAHSTNANNLHMHFTFHQMPNQNLSQWKLNSVSTLREFSCLVQELLESLVKLYFISIIKFKVIFSPGNCLSLYILVTVNLEIKSGIASSFSQFRIIENL